MNQTLSPLRGLLGAAVLGLACHAPTSLAALATGVADASLMVTNGSGYQLINFTVAPSEATAVLGDALADADGDVLALPDGVLVTGTVFADALFAPASAASANYSSLQPLFVLNTSGASNTVDFSFDWSFVLDAVNDFIAPLETAEAQVTVSLQQVVNNVTSDLFSDSALVSIATGAFDDAGSFAFSYTLAPGELTSFLVGINASAQAVTAVPLPASALLLAPALGMLGLRRRKA
jgi:hypothetical protein